MLGEIAGALSGELPAITDELFGLSVGICRHGEKPEQRRQEEQPLPELRHEARILRRAIEDTEEFGGAEIIAHQQARALVARNVAHWQTPLLTGA